MAEPGPQLIRRRVVVHGRVQGVFFRARIEGLAKSRGVAGWVRNRTDGTVEALLEGRPDAVEALVAFCREGPRHAEVTGIDEHQEEPEGIEGFRVR